MQKKKKAENYTICENSGDRYNQTDDSHIILQPLFYTRMRHGEFDPPEMNPYNKIGMEVIQSEAHRYLAIQTARMSFVLLKNEKNLLPITKKYNKVAVSLT